MDIAVTTPAGRRLFETPRARLGVSTFAVGFHARSMAGLARRRLKLGFVRQLRNIAMTARALECAMNRLLEDVLVDLQRDVLAISGLLHSRRAVATETSFFRDWLRP